MRKVVRAVGNGRTDEITDALINYDATTRSAVPSDPEITI